MCGIAGILTNNSGHENLEILTQQMQKALQHHGPDDRGVYISPNRQAAIAHTRLAILDLSVAGHQPMSTTDGRYWITFIRLAAGKQLLIQAVPAVACLGSQSSKKRVFLPLSTMDGMISVKSIAIKTYA